MSVIEFETSIENGIIKIPDKFINEISSRVKVIILDREGNAGKCKEPEESQIKKFRELPESMLKPIKTGNFKFFTREELNER